MDNMQFGAFVAQLRKEQGFTQKELADRLNVTDKAVSKWETAKGFPDVKLLEPLAQALGVSLVDLMQGRRQESETLTMAEAGAVVSQAIGQSERIATRRYLRLFRWFLTAICGLCLLIGGPFLIFAFVVLTSADFLFGAAPPGVIGGADGPTAIITASAPSSTSLFWMVGILLILLAVCIVLAVKVWRLEKKLK